jgi:hypothetical protein
VSLFLVAIEKNGSKDLDGYGFCFFPESIPLAQFSENLVIGSKDMNFFFLMTLVNGYKIASQRQSKSTVPDSLAHLLRFSGGAVVLWIS